MVGRRKQYFIAEATKSLNLADTSKSERDGDGLWVGCDVVDKSGRLCEHTLVAATDKTARYPTFVVTDLRRDSRFNELPFVKGEPFFRYYAGTPLTNKKGINIGSLFILDDVERPHLTENEVEVLGTLAQTAMNHLESTAEAKEKQKIQRLSLGLNAFVEGRHNLTVEHMQDQTGDRWATSEGTSAQARRKNKAYESRSVPSATPLSPSQGKYLLPMSALLDSDQLPETLLDLFREESESSTSHEESDADSKGPQGSDMSYKSTLIRASNIIYEALRIEGHGGVVFFDSTTKRRQAMVSSSKVTSSGQGDESLPAEVLTSTTADTTLPISVRKAKSCEFSPLQDEVLHGLLRTYPKGRLWSLDRDLSSSSEEEFSGIIEEPARRTFTKVRRERKLDEGALLRKHFPGVKQLLFYGLWDAGSSRWFTTCFAWTTSAQPIFSVETELNYLITFGNSIMAQVSRLASMVADRQKADFIGSISHELRSPLHGILASAEFLSEATEDAFQQGLVETVFSCGRTLLDTINHILDYSKINSFEQTWKSSRARRQKDHKGMKPLAATKMNLSATIDVAAVVEEVLDGIHAGHVFNDLASAEGSSPSTAYDCHITAKDVDVILDIQFDNYIFVTQPGALKRLVMNIFGNALKYTQRGIIIVNISLDDVQDLQIERPERYRTLQLRITDTGKGISREYLRTSLYNAFSQEDNLASGTGLGLSIVRSIVTMLQGAIDVQSEVGVGTQVTIRIPLSPLPSTNNNTSSLGSDSLPINDSIEVLKRDYANNSISLYGFEGSALMSVLQSYVRDWFGLQPVGGLNSFKTHLYLVEEDAFLSFLANFPPNAAALILCRGKSRSQVTGRLYGSRVIEFVTKPCGPYKLAKAIRICFEKTGHQSEFPGWKSDDAIEDRESSVDSAEPRDNEAKDSRNTLTNGHLLPVADNGPRELQLRRSDDRNSGPHLTNSVVIESNPSIDNANSSFTPPVSQPPRPKLSSPQPLLDLAGMHNSKIQTGTRPSLHSPRILLVDDNAINLRLLQTYMKKRSYQNVDTAEDGKLAVEAVETRESSYSIIFMGRAHLSNANFGLTHSQIFLCRS